MKRELWIPESEDGDVLMGMLIGVCLSLILWLLVAAGFLYLTGRW